MNTKNIIPILLLLAGEALIIISFLFFGKSLGTEILTLNIVVTSIIYSLFFVGILVPIVDFKDKSQKTIGSLGVRWFVTSLYILMAIGVMVTYIQIKTVDVNSQIIIQSILFFLLLFGLYYATSSSGKVELIYTEEKQNVSRLEDLKKAMIEVLDQLDQLKNAPTDLRLAMTWLQEDLRYVSPCNTQDAYDLEINFLNEIKAVKDGLFEYPLNSDRIIERIQNCQKICNARKKIYSN